MFEKRKEEAEENVYGYCPKCGAPGKSRERRPNGDDRCDNDHRYPSKNATKTPIVREEA